MRVPSRVTTKMADFHELSSRAVEICLTVQGPILGWNFPGRLLLIIQTSSFTPQATLHMILSFGRLDKVLRLWDRFMLQPEAHHLIL